MTKFKDYIILNGSDTRRESAQSELERRVRECLKVGWMPLGGVVYMGTETVDSFTCHVFCQAMGKPEPDEAPHGYFAGSGSLAYVPDAQEPVAATDSPIVSE